MIISHKHRFIFIKTRKTAGTSIDIALSKVCGDEDIITDCGLPEDRELREVCGGKPTQNIYYDGKYTFRHWLEYIRKRKKIHFKEHLPAEKAKKMLGHDTWNRYFKFCVERNPWDKALSLYYWRTRDMDSPPSFINFLRSCKHKHLSNWYFYTINDELAVDYVVQYAELTKELENIAQKLRFTKPVELPRAKGGYRSIKNKQQKLIGKNETNIIEKICHKEIKCFGYRLEDSSMWSQK